VSIRVPIKAVKGKSKGEGNKVLYRNFKPLLYLCSSAFICVPLGFFIARKRGVRKMDRESDMAEGDMACIN